MSKILRAILDLQTRKDKHLRRGLPVAHVPRTQQRENDKMLDGLITIAGGILAASALIIARKPNAKQLIDKLTPYQGWIGVCSAHCAPCR